MLILAIICFIMGGAMFTCSIAELYNNHYVWFIVEFLAMLGFIGIGIYLV